MQRLIKYKSCSVKTRRFTQKLSNKDQRKENEMGILIGKIKEKMLSSDRNHKIQLLRLALFSWFNFYNEEEFTCHMLLVIWCRYLANCCRKKGILPFPE